MNPHPPRTTRWTKALCLACALVPCAVRASWAQEPHEPFTRTITSGRPDQTGPARQLIVRPPSVHVGQQGAIRLEPNVETRIGGPLAGPRPPESKPPESRPPQPRATSGSQGSGFLFPFHQWLGSDGDSPSSRTVFSQSVLVPPAPPANADQLPPIAPPANGQPESVLDPAPETSGVEPVFDQVFQEACMCRPEESWLSRLVGGFHGFNGAHDDGIGLERVMHAPMVIDTTAPQNNYRLRFDGAYGFEYPDKAEYFWAKTAGGRGPLLPENEINYQELRFLTEIGGPSFSVATEIPIRIIDPEFNPNHTGLGDLTVTTKTLLLDGKRWQISQIFRTYINTGSPFNGLGTGHVSLEPGFAYRYEWTKRTFLFADMKYNFPLGGDPIFSGQVFIYGVGVSHVLMESDTTAVIPTLEVVNWTLQNGLETVPSVGPVSVNGDGIVNIFPGLRYVWDTGGDLGLMEFGFRAGISVSNDRFYEGLFGLDVRWVW